MADFAFLHNILSHTWVILAPRRAKRPDVANGTEPPCPFCPGREGDEPELYRVGGVIGDSSWTVRVLPNKYPFAPIHEVIIHSPEHRKNIDELALSQVITLFQAYRTRYNEHSHKGHVILFHNRGQKAGESLTHPHTQLAVVPFPVTIHTPTVSSTLSDQNQTISSEVTKRNFPVTQSPLFTIFCPSVSQWPDEVWIAPKKRGRTFGEITDQEIEDLAATLSQLIRIFTLRHNNDFPFNFYIYPGGDWYLRIIPRNKSIGGFELSTGIFVNTQDPLETANFIATHFVSPDVEKIKTEHLADYHRTV